MRINTQTSINQINQPETNVPPQKAPTAPKSGVGATSDGFDSLKTSTKDEYSAPTPEFDSREIDKQLVDPSDLFKYFGTLNGSDKSDPVSQGSDKNDPVSKGSDDLSAGSAGSTDLNAILHDPNLPFEEKMALFLFDFLEKAEKDLLSKMEQLDKSRNAQKTNGTNSTNGTNGNQTVDGQDAVGANQGTTQGANAQSTESEQIAMEKLKLAHEKMTKMFSIVDNILTSNSRTVKDGPIAALKG